MANEQKALVKQLRLQAARSSSRREETMEWKAADAILAAYEAGVIAGREEAARLADQLGGDRERGPLREGNDVHARSDQVIRAQHVRASTIATAIRALNPVSQKGEP